MFNKCLGGKQCFPPTKQHLKDVISCSMQAQPSKLLGHAVSLLLLEHVPGWSQHCRLVVLRCGWWAMTLGKDGSGAISSWHTPLFLLRVCFIVTLKPDILFKLKWRETERKESIQQKRCEVRENRHFLLCYWRLHINNKPLNFMTKFLD